MTRPLEGKFRIEANALGVLTRIYYNDEPINNATLVRFEASVDGAAELTLRIIPVGGLDIEGELTANVEQVSPVAPIAFTDDGPSCPDCGSITQRTGSCHTCVQCGSTTGCG